jgi:hypothetical protein
MDAPSARLTFGFRLKRRIKHEWGHAQQNAQRFVWWLQGRYATKLSRREQRLVDAISLHVVHRLKNDPDLMVSLLGNVRVSAAVNAFLSTGKKFIELDGLSAAPQFPARDEMYEYVLKHIPQSGMCLEFGVAAGDSIRFCAKKRPDRTFYGFDSFIGLPETWHEHGVGAYSQGGKFPPAPKNVSFVKGWFNESLPGFIETNRTELEANGIALLHIDSDIYSAAKTIFDLLTPYLRVGTIIMFDEFWNYTTWEEHEYKAFMEFLAANPNVRYSFHSYVPGALQLSVRIDAI